MPAIIDKIADALHLHHYKEGQSSAEGSQEKTPVFDKSKVTVFFVLGGPGAGKPSSTAPSS